MEKIYNGDDKQTRDWVDNMAAIMAPAYYVLVYVTKCMPLEYVPADLQQAVKEYAAAQGEN